MLDVETLYRECSEDLYRALRRRFDWSVPDALIEDACQAAWVIAWRYRERISDESPMGWLVTVARHELLALLRKQRNELVSDQDVNQRDNRSDPVLALEAREALEALATLGENQRLAIGLNVAGHSYSDVAEVTGKTYTWVNPPPLGGPRPAARAGCRLRQAPIAAPLSAVDRGAANRGAPRGGRKAALRAACMPPSPLSRCAASSLTTPPHLRFVEVVREQGRRHAREE